MPKRYRPREVIRVLESLGWRVARQHGSHVTLTKHGEINDVTVSVSRREVVPSTFANILRQARMTRQDFDSQADDAL